MINTFREYLKLEQTLNVYSFIRHVVLKVYYV